MSRFHLLSIPLCLMLLGCPPQQHINKEKGGKTGAVKLDCKRPNMLGPVLLTDAQFKLRHGTGITSIDLLENSKARPVEVCHVRGQLAYLIALRCPDGSKPFTSPRHAHSNRVGNVGPGGRCGSIIDLYEVPCPDQPYKVFMDMYMCGPSGFAPPKAPSEGDPV